MLILPSQEKLTPLPTTIYRAKTEKSHHQSVKRQLQIHATPNYEYGQRIRFTFEMAKHGFKS